METLLGRFSLQKAIGHGGVARVFLAKDLLLGRDVAVKLIHEHLAGDQLVCGRFKRELAIARTIAHPRILELFEFHEDGGRRFITMEYLPGGDLKSRILAQGALGRREATAIALDILEALGHAHAFGVVHRDVKPHNMLFDAAGRVKVSDFGLARIGSGEGFSAVAVSAGTPEYCPPELVAGQLVDSRGDLYSFGVVLFEMLAGRLPFSADSPFAILRLHLEAPPPDPRALEPDIPEALAEIVLRCLAKDPADRFQTAGELAGAIKAVGVPGFVGAGAIAPGQGRQEALPDERRLRCPGCGRSLSFLLPYCFSCGSPALTLEPAAAGTEKTSIVVMGPGRPGFKLDDANRQELLALLASEAGDLQKLKRSIPRLPFTLAQGLDGSSARLVAAEFENRGLKTLVTGRGRKEANREARKAFLGKLAALVPRLWLIILGGSTGMWSQLGRAVTKDGGLIAPVLVILAFLVGVPAVAALVYAKPIVKKRKKPGTGDLAARLSAQLHKLPASLESPAFQGMAHDVARKLEILVRNEARLDLTEKDKEGLGRDLGQWVELCLCAQALEHYVRNRPEALVMREIRDLEGRPAGREAEERLSGLKDELARRRDIERTLDQAMDRLLSFSARLDAEALGLSASRLGELGLSLDKLSASLADAGDLVEASRESGLLPGGTER